VRVRHCPHGTIGGLTSLIFSESSWGKESSKRESRKSISVSRALQKPQRGVVIKTEQRSNRRWPTGAGKYLALSVKRNASPSTQCSTVCTSTPRASAENNFCFSAEERERDQRERERKRRDQGGECQTTHTGCASKELLVCTRFDEVDGNLTKL